MDTTWDETINKFSEYVYEFEVLKKKHPKSVTVKGERENVFTKTQLAKWPVLKEIPSKFFPYIERLVKCLDHILIGISEEKKTKVLYFIFDNIDLYFVKGDYDNKLRTHVFGVKKIFFKPAKFWRSYKKSPVEASRSFQTFGPYYPDHPVEIVRIDDLTDKFSVNSLSEQSNPLSEKDRILIGLFPLSAQFQRSFKVTRSLNDDRKTYGFLTDKILHDNFKDELDNVLKIIHEEELDVACFPELLINEDAQIYLANGIRALNKRFFILIAGSDHRIYDAGHYKNTIPVLIFIDGNIHQFHYSKLDFFHLNLDKRNIKFLDTFMENFRQFFPDAVDSPDVFLKEDIVSDPSLLLLTSKKFGDIGFVICKDFLPDTSDIIRNYTKIADHLFIVAMNNSKNADFQERAIHLSKEHGIAVFYVNARSFDPNLNSPSFYSIPLPRRKLINPEDILPGKIFYKYVLLEREVSKPATNRK